MTNLVIVESASKAKTIQKYLNDSTELQHLGPFKVLASLGHIVDLPAKEIAVDTSSWTVKYETIKTKAKTIKTLKDAAKSATRVFLASDPDREGASIAKHLQTVLKLPNTVPRLLFHEITPTAMVKAVLSPSSIDEKLVAAQETRRILDRIVGYELSPLLWRRFATSSLSAGRVQSAALKLLVDRADEQESHVPQHYHILHGTFALHGDEARYAKNIETRAYNGASLASWNEEDVQPLLKAIAKSRGEWLATFSKKDTMKSPPAPFSTSTLQQEAYSRYGFPAKRTMQLAQALYEAGHITYMRTDSLKLSKDAQAAILDYIKAEIGEEWAQPRAFKTKAANAQEAHEAIRPTKTYSKTLPESETITSQHIKLYQLIWQRTIASQMIPARYSEVTIAITPPDILINSNILADGTFFKGVHTILTGLGYLTVYSPDQHVDTSALSKWDNCLAKSSSIVNAITFKAEGDVTRPVSQYNEPQLVKALEKHGIGRPSTFATIIDKLSAKNYICKGVNPQSTHDVRHYIATVGSVTLEEQTETIIVGGKDTDRMVPTNLGRRVIQYLDTIAPFLLDVGFTAEMENDLDKIARGDVKETDVLNNFYGTFQPTVQKAKKEQKDAAQSSSSKKTSQADTNTGGEKPSRPSKVIRDFEQLGACVVQTKYGLALFDQTTSSFTSLGPFLEWRNASIESLTSKDVCFLRALPLQREDGTQIAIGRYGLYVKSKDGKNLRLPRNEWNEIYEAFH